MCGRFALGLQADDIPAALNGDYFGLPAHQNQQNDDDGADVVAHQEAVDGDQGQQQQHQAQPGPSGHTREGGNEQQHGSKEQVGESAVDGPVSCASFESKTGYRVRYNVCPKSRSVVLRKSEKAGEYNLDLLVWGLIPSWFKEPPQGGRSTINAQCESVFEGKPSWRGPRENRRCVVIAQGFYEWLQKGKEKVPHFVKRKDGKLMAFAGLWDHCDYKGTFEPVTTYTILTTPVNSQLRFLHSRMPAILNDASEIELWLANTGWNDKVKALVRPFQGKVECYPVDQGVGKVGNESPDFIKPVAAKKGSLDTLFAKQAKSQSTTSSPAKPGPSSLSTPKSASTSPSSSTKPKLKSGSPPSPSGSGSNAKVKGEDEDSEAMNPDEDSPRKVVQLTKAEEDLEGGGSGKKRKKEVEVLELVDSSDEEAAAEEPVKKKVKSAPALAKGASGEKHVDEKGNEALTDFFPVVD
ncbi:hypothetical protein JCM6882_003134 [Rhodosporidiobolus microsporus]